MTTKRKKIVAMGALISIVAVAALAIPGMKTYKRVMVVSESASYETAIAEESKVQHRALHKALPTIKKRVKSKVKVWLKALRSLCQH